MDVREQTELAALRLRVKDLEQAAAELRLSNARLRRLHESGVIGIVSGEMDSINDANDVFLRMLGYTREEFTPGKFTWQDVTPPGYEHADLKAREQLLESGEFLPYEKEYFRKDRSRIPVLIGGTSDQREPISWTCFVIDLSERKSLESKLAAKQKLETVGMLAGGIAHDFNNMLAGILGYASLAKDLLPADAGPAEYLQEIVRIGEQAAQLTRQMLAYSGRGRLVVEPVSLSGVVRDMKSLLQPFVPGKIKLYLDLDPDLPPTEGDRSQIQQVFTNLVVNASDAIGDQPGTIVVRTGAQEIDEEFIRWELDNEEVAPGRYVWLQVSDSGPGIDDATMARIFDPFFSTKFMGTGLGLAAVSGIVRAHKGAIKVSSTPGKGSSFRVFFPAHERAVQAVAFPDTAAGEDLRGDARILIVDDEEAVRLTAKLSLEKLGYDVLLAKDGYEAIEVFRAQADRISVIILDFSMPGMSGQETLPELEKIRADVPVLISSGYLESETAPLFAGGQVAGFMQKPYTFDSLARKVKETLSRPGRGA